MAPKQQTDRLLEFNSLLVQYPRIRIDDLTLRELAETNALAKQLMDYAWDMGARYGDQAEFRFRLEKLFEPLPECQLSEPQLEPAETGN